MTPRLVSPLPELPPHSAPTHPVEVGALTNLTPISGTTTGDTTVVITCTNLTSGTVTFGGLAAICTVIAPRVSASTTRSRCISIGSAST